MKKRVLYVITKSAWGGAQRYVYDLATRLPSEQFNVAVACGGEGPLVEKLKRAGMRIIPIPHFERDIDLRKELLTLFSLIKIFIRESPDIIHLNSAKAGGIGAVAGFVYKTLSAIRYLLFAHRPLPRIIFTVHGWTFHEARPRWQRSFIIFFSWLGALFQDRIILVSRRDYASAQRLISPKKLLLIFNGLVSAQLFSKSESRNFFAQNISAPAVDTDILIGVIAELSKTKGLAHLLDAAAILKTRLPQTAFRVLIIGEGEERGGLEEKIRNLKLDGEVFLLGYIPEASRYLAGFDIFALTSVKEGLPYALMEAMSAGLPVVATRVGGVPDLIRDQKNGIIVPPKDPIAIATALQTLIENPRKRGVLAGEARRAIADNFPLDAMITKTTALYLKP